MALIYEETLGEIEANNIKTQSELQFQQILAQNRDALIDKIIDSSLCKYKVDFSKDGILDTLRYSKYLGELRVFIQKYFLDKDNLEINDIIDYHSLILSYYSDEQLKKMNIYKLGELRSTGIMAYNLDENEKLKNRNYFISHNKVNKKMHEALSNYNSSKKDILEISKFFHESISNIHPFNNGNGRVFFTLIDILLLKHNYLPLFIMQDKEQYEKVIQLYFHDRNFNKLILNFLDFINNKYKKYQIK